MHVQIKNFISFSHRFEIGQNKLLKKKHQGFFFENIRMKCGNGFFFQKKKYHLMYNVLAETK